MLVGGAAAALGTLFPVAQVANFYGQSSFSLIQAGVYGPLLLVVAALLGSLPIFLKRYMRFSVAGFGVSCGLFALFLALWIAESGLAGTFGGAMGGNSSRSGSFSPSRAMRRW